MSAASEYAERKQLWRGELPTSARATPMTLRGTNGHQYLVIAAGGHGIKGMGPLGDYPPFPGTMFCGRRQRAFLLF